MHSSRIEPEVLTIPEVALECRVSAFTVRRWLRLGQLEHIVLPSGRRVIPKEALGQFQRLPAKARNGQRQGSRRSL